jgi:methionyl-tRNA synthetase
VSRFYVTSAIPYATDSPHVGHAYELVICDALARWHRLIGDDVFFLTGTDEHGLKMIRSAEAAGASPAEHAERTAGRYVEAWQALGLSNDDFIRTSEPRHHAAVQALLQRVFDNGDIELATYEGPYCVSCEAYYTDEELENGKCPVHHTYVEQFKEENYFFKLSRYEERLTAWLEQDPSPVQPASRRNEALGLIRQGLRDVSITRTSIDWGVPVPWDQDHVFYVWYDALINYATAIGFAADPERFEAWWPHVNHVIGKDILRFHCVYWPAMLLSAGIEPPAHVWVHGFLLLGGEKLSKSNHNVTEISPDSLIGDVGVDGARYHLLRDVPFGPDGEYSYEGVVARFNSDLANNLGNLLSRVSTVVNSKCGGVGPAPQDGSPLQSLVAGAYDAAAAAWARFAPNEALEATWRIIRETNAYLEANEPWKAEPGPAVEAVLGDALEALRIVAVLASPAIPATCDEIWRRLGLDGSAGAQRLPDAARWGGYPGGLTVTKGAPLFPRLS